MTTELENITAKKLDLQSYLHKGVTYEKYKLQMAQDLLLNTDPKIKEYINLNQHRMNRVEKTYATGNSLAIQIENLQQKVYWLVLTEHWCGDASQTLPVFDKIAKESGGKIELKLVYRDENPELMDAYLTNGSRSIPKLVQLNESLQVTGVWGPRPAAAQQLVLRLKSNPATAATYSNELHLWYAKNKQQDLETEIAKLLLQAGLLSNNCLS